MYFAWVEPLVPTIWNLFDTGFNAGDFAVAATRLETVVDR